MSKKKKLLISFSGGRTSGYMLWWLYNEWEDRNNWEMVTVFSNTGKEVDGTLFFIDECSQEWGIPIVWIEAVPVSDKGWAVQARITNYNEASRNGEPFEAMIKKLGIPNRTTPFCSPQLKREAILSFAKIIGWKDFYVAIGIRYDEPDRINNESKKQKILYPLVYLNPTTKRQVSEWWNKQPFDLNIHPDDGNCDNCWKKSDARLARNMIRKPNSFIWWEEMQDKYSMLNPRDNDSEPPYYFFRGRRTVMDIRNLAEMSQAELKQLSMFEQNDGCQESCEVF